MLTTVLGIVNVFRLPQNANEPGLRTISVFGIEILVKLVEKLNALLAIFVTPIGIE